MIRSVLRRLFRRTPDYYDGQWHFWRSGPCPVSAGTIVEAYIYLKSDQPVLETLFASELDWAHEDQPITRFRVVSSNYQPTRMSIPQWPVEDDGWGAR